MSRCKACDAIMTESELKRIDYNTVEHLDLCYECMVESERAVRDSEVEEVLDLSELGFDISNN
jgi:hypothetical protein